MQKKSMGIHIPTQEEQYQGYHFTLNTKIDSHGIIHFEDGITISLENLKIAAQHKRNPLIEIMDLIDHDIATMNDPKSYVYEAVRETLELVSDES